MTYIGGLRGLTSEVIIGVLSTLNLQVLASKMVASMAGNTVFEGKLVWGGHSLSCSCQEGCCFLNTATWNDGIALNSKILNPEP